MSGRFSPSSWALSFADNPPAGPIVRPFCVFFADAGYATAPNQLLPGTAGFLSTFSRPGLQLPGQQAKSPRFARGLCARQVSEKKKKNTFSGHFSLRLSNLVACWCVRASSDSAWHGRILGWSVASMWQQQTCFCFGFLRFLTPLVVAICRVSFFTYYAWLGCILDLVLLTNF